MSPIRRIHRWLFAPTKEPVTAARVIAWWELRRIPFNLILACWGLLWLAVLLWAARGSGRIQPDHDVFEPVLLPLMAIAANGCYTLVWIVEIHKRRSEPALPADHACRVFGRGLRICLIAIAFPGAWWLGIRVLQALGVLA